MGRNRGRLDITADILRVVSGKAKKTQILYQANLSYTGLQRYLAEIVEASLIIFEKAEKHYVLTQKGREFLETYKGYTRTNKSIEKQLDEICTRKRILEDLCAIK